MEELRPEELEELVQELEEESDEEEGLSPEVEELLRALQLAGADVHRYHAAHGLGNVKESSPRILRALAVAQKVDRHGDIRRAAARSLRAPVHQEYLRQHPEVEQSLEQALAQVAGKGETESASLLRCLKAGSVAGLAVSLVIQPWVAKQWLVQDGGLTCGTGFVVAFLAGAVVGAIVGEVVHGREDLVRGSVVAAASAGVVAAVSWLPITFILIVMSGGP